jgi:hypothetical protein
MLLELLGAVGVTNILVRGSVFAWLRRAFGFRMLLGCAMCTGWWVGVALDLALHGRDPWTARSALELVVAGGAVSALATLLDFTLAWLDSHTDLVKP